MSRTIRRIDYDDTVLHFDSDDMTITMRRTTWLQDTADSLERLAVRTKHSSLPPRVKHQIIGPLVEKAQALRRRADALAIREARLM